MPDFVRIVKKDLFEVPPIFNKIKEASGMGNHEMYQVFNMGCRMEIYIPENKAAEIMDIADTFEIEAKIIGKVESSEEKELIIECADEILYYQ